jgi:hypothetical protein
MCFRIEYERKKSFPTLLCSHLLHAFDIHMPVYTGYRDVGKVYCASQTAMNCFSRVLTRRFRYYLWYTSIFLFYQIASSTPVNISTLRRYDDALTTDRFSFVVFDLYNCSQRCLLESWTVQVDGGPSCALRNPRGDDC